MQFFCRNKDVSRWGFIKCHKEAARDIVAAMKYCQKEDTRFDGPWEFGEPPKNGRPKLLNKDIIENDIIDLIDEEKIPILKIEQYKKAKQIYILSKPGMETRVSESTGKIGGRSPPWGGEQAGGPGAKIGEWLYGPPRTGKSTMARQNKPYIKMPNKWWDDYMGEDEVLLEDVEPSMEGWLGYFLKIWTDHWNFRAEIKGGSALIGPFKKFWITSNFAPNEIFKDEKILEAINYRFNIRMLSEI